METILWFTGWIGLDDTNLLRTIGINELSKLEEAIAYQCAQGMWMLRSKVAHLV